jgi:hypothetical protein
MTNTSCVSRLFLAATLSMAVLGPALAQSEVKRAAIVVPAVQEINYKKNVFAGNEARIGAMNIVNADCTSTAIPDIRIVAQPAKGELRLENIQYALDREKTDRRAHCNGKIVDAVGIFYKAKDDKGQDRLVLDVDFKNGTVRRYSFTLNLR